LILIKINPINQCKQCHLTRAFCYTQFENNIISNTLAYTLNRDYLTFFPGQSLLRDHRYPVRVDRSHWSGLKQRGRVYAFDQFQDHLSGAGMLISWIISNHELVQRIQYYIYFFNNWGFWKRTYHCNRKLKISVVLQVLFRSNNNYLAVLVVHNKPFCFFFKIKIEIFPARRRGSGLHLLVHNQRKG
jgi:hypothetical protein